MTIDETTFPPIQQPSRGALLVIIAIGAALAAALASAMSARGSDDVAIRGVSEQCDSRDCVSPRQIVTLSEAALMKRRLGNRALVVDIRSEGETTAAAAIGADVRAPFFEPASPPGMEFRLDFPHNVDEALLAARMKHDEPVILLSPSLERSVLAALLLQEHGYSRILVLRTTSAARTPRA